MPCTSLTLLAALITGCNSNDDDNAALTQVPSTTQVTVTPSLGKILNAKVVLRNANTGLEIGSGNTGNSGIATFNVTKTTAPVVVEVQGSATAKYVDESKLSATNTGEVNFDAAQKIRATVPTLATNIGVSTLTEVAYQTALKKASNNEKAISADIATKANEAVRKALAPELTSITAAPTVIGSFADLAAIQNTEAGKYALKLAALAQLVPNTDTTPALAALQKLAEDFADGNFDGMANGAAVGLYTQANLQSKIQANLTSIFNAANLLGFDANTFTFGFGSITIDLNTGGNTTIPTGNYNLAITTTVSGFSSPVINIPNIPKPTTKTEFCAAEDVTDVFDVAGSSFTINSCSFSGNIGDITATVSVQGFNTTYNAHYVYTAM